ncbi:hypothetical protein BU15DRAFT_63760 [Melanogaster broomeanus]|nr:hypothetical protein BU15DRAFT_63760 [Melanogaster broomeanus]
MSTQAQHSGVNNSWNQPQYSFKHPLQLEQELPYLQVYICFLILNPLPAANRSCKRNTSARSKTLKDYKVNDEHDDNQAEPSDALQEAEVARPKAAGACARCKSLKVRCEFRGDGDTCRRCLGAGQECVIPGRKPRRTPPKREHLMNQIRDQAKKIEELTEMLEVAKPAQSPMEINSEAVVPNAEVQDWIAKARESPQAFGSLLPSTEPKETIALVMTTLQMNVLMTSRTPPKQAAAKLNMLPGDDAPYGLMAALAIKKGRDKSVEPESSEAVGVANANFFMPTHGNLTPTGMGFPHILVRGIVTVQEVDELFKIYFEKMNPSVQLTGSCPLYSSTRSYEESIPVYHQFYTPRPDLYAQLMEYAQLAAGTALISGPKNEEMSAAYLLMQLYPVPAKRWDEERSWIYLESPKTSTLNRPVTDKHLNEQNARILLSRQRIWMNCFNLDRSTGSQYGKREIIPNTDYFASHSEDWWKSSPYNMKGFDIHLCGYNAELKDDVELSPKDLQRPKSRHWSEQGSSVNDWFKRLDEFEEEKTEMWAFRTELLKMAYAYARLCLNAASDIVNAFVRRLFPTTERKVLLRHAPDAQFVFVTFAGAFLVKLLQPKYSHYFTNERRKEIRTLVQEAVDLLGAPEVVVDDKHGPKLFSRFLAGLLASQSANAGLLSRPRMPMFGATVQNQKGRAKKLQAGIVLLWAWIQWLSRGYSPSAVETQDDLAIHPSDLLFQPPMLIDQELLESMQLSDPNIWPAAPAFSWMNQLSTASNPSLYTNDYAMYESQQYGSTY